jgi:CubicO group peptidase (beta-lactamase class C family)
MRSCLSGIIMAMSSGPPSVEPVGEDVPSDLGDGWPVAAASQVGLDAAVLHEIGARFESWKEASAHAVVVVRRGVLVYERYFPGDDWHWNQHLTGVAFDATVRHDVRSITKSITSLLVGVARARGCIGSLDTPVVTFFPEYADLCTPEWERITLAHLLTMSSGLSWQERVSWDNPANDERAMDEAADPYRYVLQRPVETLPGRYFQYCGGAPTLLQGIIQNTSNSALDVLAKEALFEPLGIQDVEWIRFRNGDPKGFGGLRLRARDLAKIGQLVLDRGRWQGKQIIPSEWIAESTEAHINGEGILFYGYQWWLGRAMHQRREFRWIAGLGNGGQRLYILPELEVVIAVFSGAYSVTQIVGETILKHYVLPAVMA